MNNVVSFAARLLNVVSGTALLAPLPVIIPEGKALRIRAVEFRQRTYANTDAVVLAGLSPVNLSNPFLSIDAIIEHQRFMAFFGWGFGESGTTGESAMWLYQRTELWDYNYQLIMPPILHLMVISTVAKEVTCVLHGEYVPVSVGRANAIIAWQGGAK